MILPLHKKLQIRLWKRCVASTTAPGIKLGRTDTTNDLSQRLEKIERKEGEGREKRGLCRFWRGECLCCLLVEAWREVGGVSHEIGGGAASCDAFLFQPHSILREKFDPEDIPKFDSIQYS